MSYVNVLYMPMIGTRVCTITQHHTPIEPAPCVTQVPTFERRRRTDLTDPSLFHMISVDKRGTTDINALLHVRKLEPGSPYIGQGSMSGSSSSGSGSGGSGVGRDAGGAHGGRGGRRPAGAGRAAVYEVGVHVADVAAFVSAGSALDMEARAR